MDSRPLFMYPKMQLEDCALGRLKVSLLTRHTSSKHYTKRSRRSLPQALPLDCDSNISVKESRSSSIKHLINGSPCTRTRCQPPTDTCGLDASKNSESHLHFDCIITGGTAVKQGGNLTKQSSHRLLVTYGQPLVRKF